MSGWFTEDFALDELRTLRARERLAFRSHGYDGQFAVPTFEEVLALADSAGRRRGRVVGVYPETKHPSYFRSIGLPLEPKLLAALSAYGLNRRGAPVFIQSFESANLRALRAQTRVRLVQLVSDTAQVTPAALREIATYADGIGANTRLIVPSSAGAAPTSLVRDAHAAGLLVHAWTLRPEAQFLSQRYGGDPLAEVRELATLGVDGLFADYPDVALKGLGRSTGPTPPGAAPILDVRLASSKPVPDFKLMVGPDEHTSVYVAPGTLVSDIDVQDAHSKQVNDGLVLHIQLSQEAAARLRAATSGAVGQHLAVLANGRLAAVAIIVEPIPVNNRVSLGLTLPEDVADDVRARVAARWPQRAP